VRPVGREGAARRDRQLRAVADAVARGAPGPTVVVGDLNATRWSAGFAPLIGAGLRDSATGWGWQPTWPADLGPLGVPIDHVLHSPDLRVVSRSVPAWPGSDHRAVQAVLALPPAVEGPAAAVRSAAAAGGGAYDAPRRVNPPPLARLGQGPT
jgi:endonuclease/exonuclease/phosphatase (EEP) superfamily protein YafD